MRPLKIVCFTHAKELRNCTALLFAAAGISFQQSAVQRKSSVVETVDLFHRPFTNPERERRGSSAIRLATSLTLRVRKAAFIATFEKDLVLIKLCALKQNAQ